MADEIETEEEEAERFDGDTEEAYFGRIELPELRRFVSLEAARCLGAAPDKAVKLASDIEKFLIGSATNLKLVKSE